MTSATTLYFKFPFFLLIMCLTACSKGPQSKEQIYFNDFEGISDLSAIAGGIISNYEQTKTLGRYNNDGFSLMLTDLPAHDFVEVSFDLYVHNTWDGNDQGEHGPDLWQMKMDGDMIINTTFSNCGASFCVPQSYPLNYSNNKNAPRAGAEPRNLPGVCYLAGNAGWTSLYKIRKTIEHRDNDNLELQFLDRLKQSYANDPVCDESWALDNIAVSVIKLN